MKYLIFIVSIFFFITSCSSDDDLRIEEFYEFESGKELKIVQSEFNEEEMIVNVCDGDFTVFKYSLKDLGEEGLEDSFNNQFVYFQVDNQLENFEYTDEELTELKAIYQLSCFCDVLVTNPVFIENGTISGVKKNDNSWDITINVEVNNQDIVASNNFLSTGKSFSLCDEELVNDIEEITFTGNSYGCDDFLIYKLESEKNDQTVLSISSIGKEELSLSEELKTVELPNEDLTI